MMPAGTRGPWPMQSVRKHGVIYRPVSALCLCGFSGYRKTRGLYLDRRVWLLAYRLSPPHSPVVARSRLTPGLGMGLNGPDSTG